MLGTAHISYRRLAMLKKQSISILSGGNFWEKSHNSDNAKNTEKKKPFTFHKRFFLTEDIKSR